MKYKVVIESELGGRAEFFFVANTEEEYKAQCAKYAPKAKCPCRETVYVVGVDQLYFEQLW